MMAEKDAAHVAAHVNQKAAARILKDAGGLPAPWQSALAVGRGCRFDFVNPEYR
jgi:hypothetical protein